MPKTIEVVFDGKAFVPVVPVDLPAGTKASVSVSEAMPAATLTLAEAERVLRGDGSSLPWPTVEEALAYSRGRAWPKTDTEEQP